jgi:hypothetical protein
MIDLQVVLETMAMAMVQAMEASARTGDSLIVSFTIEGGTGRIAPIVEEVPFLWEGATLPDGRSVGEYKP